MGKFDFILELGAEEIPAGYFAKALEALKNNLNEALIIERLNYEKIKVWGSPRRLALAIWQIDSQQNDFVEELSGPPITAAYDKDGNPSKAFDGFLKTHGIGPEDIIILDTKKGKYLGAKKSAKGKTAKDILIKIIPEIFNNLPFPKNMRWGTGEYQFVRPVHWLLAVLNKEVLPITFAGISANNLSYGHRFLAANEIVINSPNEYEEKLAKAHVYVDYAKRKQMIEDEIKRVLKGKENSLKIIEDKDLVDEIANLVEEPTAVLGSFDADYLKLPLAVAATVMKEHQRYFTLVDKNKNLAPNFIAISNTRAKNMAVVVNGHERVLRARLDDAKFYYFDDLKKKLIDYKSELENIVFHNLLGTVGNKVERVKSLALNLVKFLNLKVDENDLIKAVELSKCDLVTGVVKEFPDLQGIMGEDYALKSGEKEEVAKVLKEHYYPLKAGGILPSSDLASVISICDKFDTITACFAVNLIPTGTADPFALRRQVLGILNICLARNWNVSLEELFNCAYVNLGKYAKRNLQETKSDVLNFIKIRFKGYLLAHEISNDVSEAVLTLFAEKPLNAYKRAVSLENFKNKTNFLDLAQTFKRVVNIIKKEIIEDDFKDWSLLNHESEKKLLEVIEDFETKIATYLQTGDFCGLIANFVNFKKPVDDFFDSVLVNDPDEKIRKARLALLKRISKTFEVVADFSQISTG